jgi:hypothetical protein
MLDRPRCVLGNPEEPHAAALGSYVCAGHQDKLYGQLRAIVDTVARIAIRPANHGSPGAGRSGALASQRFVLDLESIALAGPLAPGDVANPDGWDEHHPLSVVGSWARMVREDRGLTPPDGPATLIAEVNLLVRHLDWCCAQPWIDDMATELAACLARVRNADPDRIRPGDEGRCPAVGMGPDGTCGGHLRRERGAVPWLVRADRCERAPVDVHAGVVRCQQCGATWPTERDEASLRLMREKQGRDATRPRTDDGVMMYTARELAADHGVETWAMRKRLQRAGVKPHDGQWYDPRVAGQRLVDLVS